MKYMAVCPYCKAEINSVLVLARTGALTQYEVLKTADGNHKWKKINDEGEEFRIWSTSCPLYQKPLFLCTKKEVDMFLDGDLIVINKSELEYFDGTKATFRGKKYAIIAEVDDLLILCPPEFMVGEDH